MKRYLVGLLLGLCTTLGAGVSAEHLHGADPLPKHFTLRITFTGAVDVLSDGTATPGTALLALPNASDVSKLPLHDDLKGASPNWTIAKHQARIFGAQLTVTAKGMRCDTSDELPVLDLTGYRWSLVGDFLEPAVTADRNVILGTQPCDPATNPSCPPIAAQVMSLGWLPKIDRILAFDPPFRSDLLTNRQILAALFEVTRGRLFSGGLWKDPDDHYVEVEFEGVPAHVWSPRATAKQVTLVVEVIGESLVLKGVPVDSMGVTQQLTIRSSNGQPVDLYVENQPVGQPVGGVYRCESGAFDFALHYILRKDSDRLTGPKLKVVDEFPSTNPQCSPADNDYP